MIEAFIGGGLLFIVGMLVGRTIGRQEAHRATVMYMATVSHVQSVMRTIHEKHGITAEVDAALKDNGIEIRQIKVDS
jgi:predicted regulator of amino acid metabolism with ACT domain